MEDIESALSALFAAYDSPTTTDDEIVFYAFNTVQRCQRLASTYISARKFEESFSLLQEAEKILDEDRGVSVPAAEQQRRVIGPRMSIDAEVSSTVQLLRRRTLLLLKQLENNRHYVEGSGELSGGVGNSGASPKKVYSHRASRPGAANSARNWKHNYSRAVMEESSDHISTPQSRSTMPHVRSQRHRFSSDAGGADSEDEGEYDVASKKTSTPPPPPKDAEDEWARPAVMQVVRPRPPPADAAQGAINDARARYLQRTGSPPQQSRGGSSPIRRGHPVEQKDDPLIDDWRKRSADHVSRAQRVQRAAVSSARAIVTRQAESLSAQQQRREKHTAQRIAYEATSKISMENDSDERKAKIRQMREEHDAKVRAFEEQKRKRLEEKQQQLEAERAERRRRHQEEQGLFPKSKMSIGDLIAKVSPATPSGVKSDSSASQAEQPPLGVHVNTSDATSNDNSNNVPTRSQHRRDDSSSTISRSNSNSSTTSSRSAGGGMPIFVPHQQQPSSARGVNVATTSSVGGPPSALMQTLTPTRGGAGTREERVQQLHNAGSFSAGSSSTPTGEQTKTTVVASAGGETQPHGGKCWDDTATEINKKAGASPKYHKLVLEAESAMSPHTPQPPLRERPKALFAAPAQHKLYNDFLDEMKEIDERVKQQQKRREQHVTAAREMGGGDKRKTAGNTFTTTSTTRSPAKKNKTKKGSHLGANTPSTGDNISPLVMYFDESGPPAGKPTDDEGSDATSALPPVPDMDIGPKLTSIVPPALDHLSDQQAEKHRASVSEVENAVSRAKSFQNPPTASGGRPRSNSNCSSVGSVYPQEPLEGAEGHSLPGHVVHVPSPRKINEQQEQHPLPSPSQFVDPKRTPFYLRSQWDLECNLDLMLAVRRLQRLFRNTKARRMFKEKQTAVEQYLQQDLRRDEAAQTLIGPLRINVCKRKVEALKRRTAYLIQQRVEVELHHGEESKDAVFDMTVDSVFAGTMSWTMKSAQHSMRRRSRRASVQSNASNVGGPTAQESGSYQSMSQTASLRPPPRWFHNPFNTKVESGAVKYKALQKIQHTIAQRTIARYFRDYAEYQLLLMREEAQQYAMFATGKTQNLALGDDNSPLQQTLNSTYGNIPHLAAPDGTLNGRPGSSGGSGTGDITQRNSVVSEGWWNNIRTPTPQPQFLPLKRISIKKTREEEERIKEEHAREQRLLDEAAAKRAEEIRLEQLRLERTVTLLQRVCRGYHRRLALVALTFGQSFAPDAFANEIAGTAAPKKNKLIIQDNVHMSRMRNAIPPKVNTAIRQNILEHHPELLPEGRKMISDSQNKNAMILQQFARQRNSAAWARFLNISRAAVSIQKCYRRMRSHRKSAETGKRSMRLGFLTHVATHSPKGWAM